MSEFFGLSQQAMEIGDYDSVIRVASSGLKREPDHVPLLLNTAKAYIEKGSFVLAQLLCKRAIEICPTSVVAWVNLGQTYIDLAENDEKYFPLAREAFEKAIELEPDHTAAYINMAFVLVAMGEHEECVETCKRALRVNPDSNKSYYNMSLSLLANHMWEEGWHCYDKTLESRFAIVGVPDFGIPRWEGQPGTVLISMEQGLGDEIMFSSMIPDLMKTNDVIIDCEPRLAGLFKRSFGCEVYGTRFESKPGWKHFNRAEYWLPAGSLGQFFRTKHEDFPGVPYLKADPERKTQWKSILSTDKPNIGIAWSGGIPGTRESRRSLSWRELRPLLEYDANWVSLQYKNTGMPEFINHWPRAVEGCDYDETAALISSLDLVITVTTTAVHCAGALGVETWCLVPEIPQWRYGTVGDKMPWYSSVELFRQDGEWPIQMLQEKLSAMGIEKCRNLYTNTPYTVSPLNSTPRLLPKLSESPGFLKYLITGLARAA